MRPSSLRRIADHVRRWAIAATAVAVMACVTPTALALTMSVGPVTPFVATDEHDAEVLGRTVDDATPRLRPLISGRPTSTPTPTPTATATLTPSPTPKPDFVWPGDGWIAQRMWSGHPYGIDIAVNTGSPVYATRDGVVLFAGGVACCNYDFYIFVQHDDGWTSLYGHMSAFAVSWGDWVKQGDLLGYSGDTGKSSGAHLHFELRSYGAPVDPISLLQQRY